MLSLGYILSGIGMLILLVGTGPVYDGRWLLGVILSLAGAAILWNQRRGGPHDTNETN